MLNQILQAMGHHPTKEKPNQVTYKSPFNPEEKTPSFFVFKNAQGEFKNFKDYSTGLGGDLFKFIMEFYTLPFPEAKKKIEELTGMEAKPKPPHSSFNQTQKKSPLLYKIISTDHVNKKRSLIEYLHERGISEETINRIKNIYSIVYEMKEKKYFAIAFQNDSGGYEIRNKYFKGNLLSKDLTTVTTGSKGVKVFEGFIDYLSYLEMNTTAPTSDYIILNSVSLIEKALTRLRGGYDLIELYLDNDKAGNNAVDRIRREIPGVKIIDKRPYYEHHKDLNELLTARAFVVQDTKREIQGANNDS